MTAKRQQAARHSASTVTIEGDKVIARTPEGQTSEMSLARLIEAAAPPRMDTCGLVLPDGVKLIYTVGRLTILVHETPPQVRSLKWIARKSRKRWGGAEYRTVRIALPYMLVLAVYEEGVVGDLSECFFRNEPLTSQQDEPCFPALLNCSRFQPAEGKPLSWICTQKLDRTPILAATDLHQRHRVGLQLLLRTLLETGFNWSSDDHEFSSWFSESTRVDPRISTIEKWQKATEKEGPLFVLDIPWLKTGLSIKQIVDRIAENYGARSNPVATERDLARIILNQQRPAPQLRLTNE